jgi:hypothetical protein
LLLKSLPDSTPYRPANIRRRKDEHCVGTAARGIVEQLYCVSRVFHQMVHTRPTWAPLVNSKVRVTTALHLTFKAQTDQGVISGESDLEGIGN